MKINLIGGGFQHEHTSTLDKFSKYIEWEFESKSNPVSFYVDREIFLALKRDKNDGKKKFGWLLESRQIVGGLLEHVIQHRESLFEVLDAIFTHDRMLTNLDERFIWTPAYGTWIHNPKMHIKTKTLSMITSRKSLTQNHRLRIALANQLKDKLDLYGRGFNPIKTKDEGLNDYMFSIAIENDCYETYYTEKITDCFATGTVPIYKGAPDIGNHFNMDGIILIDDLNNDFSGFNQDLYYSMMDAIQDNFIRSLEYDVLEDWIWEKHLKDII